ncbi:MAG: hypothetical protein Q8O46_01770 [bacterium]|nr:hypothetical protein [bacterium]
MDHTLIITTANLEEYANRRDSQGVIPELVYWLVKQSVSQVSVCRIPYGDAVNQPGWDGLVETEEAFLEFVPKGVSYWEKWGMHLTAPNTTGSLTISGKTTTCRITYCIGAMMCIPLLGYSMLSIVTDENIQAL